MRLLGAIGTTLVVGVLSACTVDSAVPGAGALPQCRFDAQCDDGLACTDDRCDDGLRCVNTLQARACVADGVCQDCAAWDDAAGCEVGVCDPELGCVAAPAPSGTVCAPARCEGDTVYSAGTCGETGDCMATATACVSGDPCVWTVCDAAQTRCLSTPALTPECGLGDHYRGVAVRALPGGAWAFERREVVFGEGGATDLASAESMVGRPDGEVAAEVPFAAVYRDYGQLELTSPEVTFQVSIAPQGTALAGHPVTGSGLFLAVAPPEPPAAPDALAGRWATTMLWRLSPWHPMPLKGVHQLLGELTFIAMDGKACLQVGGRLEGSQVGLEVRSSLREPPCASTDANGAFSLDVELAHGATSTELTTWVWEGWLGAAGELAVAQLRSRDPETGELLDADAVAVLVRRSDAAATAPLSGHYGLSALSSGVQYRGRLAVVDGRLSDAAIDRLSNVGGCAEGGAMRTPFGPEATSGPELEALVDLSLVRLDDGPGNSRERLWYWGHGTPADPSLGGTSPLWVGARATTVDVGAGQPAYATWGPAILVWQHPQAAPLVAPFDEDDQAWCLP